MAVATGLARHVLVYRTVTEATAQGSGGRAGIGVDRAGNGITGPAQWLLPFGALSAANWIALVAQRHFHEFGTTREQLAQIALNARRNAARNPKAIYRDPLTLDDYLGARMITTPLCLYDCDVPADGSTALIVSRAEQAPDTPHPALHVHAVGTALRGRPSWDQWDDMTTMSARDAAAHLWQRADLTLPTWTWPNSTTASASSRCAGSRRSGSADAGRADRSWPTAPGSRSTATSPSTPTAAADRRLHAAHRTSKLTARRAPLAPTPRPRARKRAWWNQTRPRLRPPRADRPRRGACSRGCGSSRWRCSRPTRWACTSLISAPR